MSEEIKIDNIKFGENLKRIRKQLGWSQEYLAKKLGTSKQVISHYENGQRFPKISAAARCAVVLGVSLSELTGIKPMFTPDEVKNIIENSTPVTDQMKMIDKFNQLTPENRIRFDAFLDGLLAGQEKPEA